MKLLDLLQIITHSTNLVIKVVDDEQVLITTAQNLFISFESGDKNALKGLDVLNIRHTSSYLELLLGK